MSRSTSADRPLARSHKAPRPDEALVTPRASLLTRREGRSAERDQRDDQRYRDLQCASLDCPPDSKPTATSRPTLPGSLQWQDVTHAQAVSNGGRVIAAIAEHAGRPAPGSAALALQGGTRAAGGAKTRRVRE